MSTPLVVLALVAVAGVPYLVWTRWEARAHRRAAETHAATAALGDELVPLTLHPEIDLQICIGSGACVRACPERDVLAITDGRARLINTLACVGHSACMAACPVGAIKLVYGNATRGVELPLLSPTFETNQPGIYVVGELSGMGLIRNSVEQGRQAAAAIAKSGRRASAPDQLDAIVVGGGPAGLAASLALRAHGLRAVIVDQDRYGGTIAHYPRAKVVMTGSFDLPGYGTVRKKTMSKEDLLARTQLQVIEGVRVDAIAAERGGWLVSSQSGWQQRAATVVLALGRRGAPNRLGVPGEDLPHVAYRLLEPEQFAGKRVLVVGGGNAAADCVISLAEAGVERGAELPSRRAGQIAHVGAHEDRAAVSLGRDRCLPRDGDRRDPARSRDVALRRRKDHRTARG
jgi:thioredoxin reductase (NADPH)